MKPKLTKLYIGPPDCPMCDAAVCFAKAVLEKRDAVRRRNGQRCEWAERSVEPECWRDAADDQCDACKQRALIHLDVLQAQKNKSAALRRLLRICK